MQNPYSWLKTKLTQKRLNGKTYNSTNNQPIGATDSSFSADNLYGQVIKAKNDETQFLNNTTNKPIPDDVSINSSIDSVYDNDLFHNTNPNNDRNRRKQQTTTNSQDNSNKNNQQQNDNNQSSMNAAFYALKDNMNSFWEDMYSLDITNDSIDSNGSLDAAIDNTDSNRVRDVATDNIDSNSARDVVTGNNLESNIQPAENILSADVFNESNQNIPDQHEQTNSQPNLQDAPYLTQRISSNTRAARQRRLNHIASNNLWPHRASSRTPEAYLHQLDYIANNHLWPQRTSSRTPEADRRHENFAARWNRAPMPPSTSLNTLETQLTNAQYDNNPMNVGITPNSTNHPGSNPHRQQGQDI